MRAHHPIRFALALVSAFSLAPAASALAQTSGAIVPSAAAATGVAAATASAGSPSATALAVQSSPPAAAAAAPTSASAPASKTGWVAPPAPARDGQHDFDWIHGTWKTTLKRLVRPLTGSTTWVDYEGTSTARPLWGGRANLDEFITENPATKAKTEGLTLRLYDPETRQWSLYWANAKNGTLGLPPTVGHFTNGRGEFYDEEEWEGKWIVVRYVWSDITPTSAKFEQAFSPDGGKTWEPNWISTITRVKN